MLKIENIKLNTQTNYIQNTTPKNKPLTQSQTELLALQLNNLATLNKPYFTGRDYKIGLNTGELINRTLPSNLSTIELLTPESPQYLNLAEGDKKALVHLVNAAYIIDDIELVLDDENNIPFRRYLEREIVKGNPQAVRAKQLFDAQKGIFSRDKNFKHYSLAAGYSQSPGRGVYPRDLDVVELHETLREMLENNMDDEVAKILTQRTVVVRDGKYLKGIDYVDYFKEDFEVIAEELENAANVSTNEDFNEYLRLQAAAFRKADPMLDAKADIKWATLQDTPLDFTISRENYEDKMTQTISENEELCKMLKEHGITPIPKDFLGARVAIVDKEGTEFLKRSKEFLPILAKMMPFTDEYTQVVSKKNKQTSIDVDLVTVTGDIGAYRGSITVANNLPNPDKLATKLGGGFRNAYHKQMRADKNRTLLFYEKLVPKNLWKNITENSYHYFTIGHENAHSLGPKNSKNLGKYRNIIEENKADVASISFVDKLTELGLYSTEERDGILTLFVLQNILPAKPDLSSAHRVRQIMQAKYLEDNGVYKLNKNGQLDIDIEKVIPTTKKMLEEVVRIQIDDNYQKAEQYIEKYFVWTPTMQKIAEHLQKTSSEINGTVKAPLADYLFEL